VHYLYGSKPGVAKKLVATFESDQQLRAYARWATLSEKAGVSKFEQGSALVGYQAWSSSDKRLTDDDEAEVLHNPTPSML
jgi:redox-regulated HSP33 family molecular chaperone